MSRKTTCLYVLKDIAPYLHNIDRLEKESPFSASLAMFPLSLGRFYLPEQSRQVC